MDLRIAGENALILYLADAPSPQVAAQNQALAAAIEQALGAALVDLVPSYASLLIIYDALQCDHFYIRNIVAQCLHALPSISESSGDIVTLPVYYAPEAGADLESLAEAKNLSVQDVIDLHSAHDYRVYAIGFAPGFAYLGELDERLATPRLATPRKNVPAGAVAIADRQTAVYPANSPGGWHLLGLCPTPMFDPDRTPHMPVASGDRVRFEPISREQFFALGGNLS